MCATSRSEGLRGSRMFWLLGCLLAAFLGSAAVAAASPQKNVYQSYFALPSSLPPGVAAAVVVFNTGNAAAQLRLEPALPSFGEGIDAAMPAGATRVVEGLDWITPGRPIRLASSSARVEVHLLLRNLAGELLESFPIDRPAARRQDFVVPIAGGNPACPGATPGEAAARTTLHVVPAMQRAMTYRLRAFSGQGQELASAQVGALAGSAAGIALAEVFSGQALAATRSVRVEANAPFAGYGVAEVGPQDVLGILPTTTSNLWVLEPPLDWNPAEQITHVVIYNPQAVATKVKVGASSLFVLPAGATTTLSWPGAFERVKAELPIALFLAYGQNDGCGASAQQACWDDRPWSRPRLIERNDVLAAFGPRLP